MHGVLSYVACCLDLAEVLCGDPASSVVGWVVFDFQATTGFLHLRAVPHTDRSIEGQDEKVRSESQCLIGKPSQDTCLHLGWCSQAIDLEHFPTITLRFGTWQALVQNKDVLEHLHPLKRGMS